MADEVQISNVGGDGVASEVTLARLVTSIEAMAKKMGIDNKGAAAKLQKLYNQEVKDSVKSTKEQTDATIDQTDATKDVTQATNKFAASLGGAVAKGLGALSQSTIGFRDAFLSGTDRLDAFVSHVPLVGGILGPLAGVLDDTFESFQRVAGSGASFNNSLTEMRVAAAGARMPLDEFTSMISANSDKLAAFGGTATGGAQQIVKLNKALGSQREDLLNMGLSYQDINEALIDYQYLQRAGNRGAKLNNQQMLAQAEGAARYTKNLVTLGKLTGEDVKSQQEKIAAAQMGVAMQAKLGRMSVEERAKMDILMANTLASGGQAAVDALKREFLGMPPLTEEAALFTSQFGEQVTAIRNGLADVTDSNVNGAQMQARGVDYMMDMINGASSTFARLEPGMNAAAAGLDGPMAAIANQLQGAGIKFTDFIDKNGKVDQQRLRTALEAAVTEGAARDATTDALVQQREALAKTREAFETGVIGPLMKAVAPALQEMTTYLNELVSSEEFKNFMSETGTMIREFQPNFEKFIKAFKEDPVATLKELGGKIMSGIGGIIADGLVSIFTSPKIIATMAGGVALLWGAKAVTGAMTKGIASMAGSLFSGRQSAAPTPSGSGTGRPSRAGAGIGAGIGNIGAGIGKGLGGVLKGLASGIAAFANPAVLLGGTNIALVIVGIGAAVAGATWMVGAALPTMAEGMKSFEELNGSKLVDAGLGMLSVAAGLAAIGAGGVAGAVGGAASGLIDGISGFFGAESPLDKMLAFQKYDFDADKIENNSRAMVAYSQGMTLMGGAGVVSGIGSAIGAFGGAIAGLFGADSPLDKISLFQAYNFDPTKIANNASAIEAYSKGMAALGSAEAVGGVGSILGAIGGWFSGNNDMPWESVKAFGDADLNLAGVTANAATVNAMSTSLNGFSVEKLDTTGVVNYTSAMEKLVEVLGELNDELSKDNNGWSAGTGTNAGDVMATAGKGGGGNSDQLNNTMQQVLLVLNQMRDLDDKVEKNTRNIIGSNLAQGGVSKVGR